MTEVVFSTVVYIGGGRRGGNNEARIIPDEEKAECAFLMTTGHCRSITLQWAVDLYIKELLYEEFFCICTVECEN